MSKAVKICLTLMILAGVFLLFRFSGQRNTLAREKAEISDQNKVLQSLYDQAKKDWKEAEALWTAEKEQLTEEMGKAAQERESLMSQLEELNGALKQSQAEAAESLAARNAAEQALLDAQTQARSALDQMRQEAEAASAQARQAWEDEMRTLSMEKEDTEKRLNEVLSILLHQENETEDEMEDALVFEPLPLISEEP